MVIVFRSSVVNLRLRSGVVLVLRSGVVLHGYSDQVRCNSSSSGAV
jgi:hypothetical protein